MGFTALDGLPMGTRPGQLDAGVVLYLMSEKGMSAKEIERLLYNDCGLKGLSGISNDVRELARKRRSPRQACARLFHLPHRAVYRNACRRHGRHRRLRLHGRDRRKRPAIREAVAQRLAWLGLELSSKANAKGELKISRKRSRVAAMSSRPTRS